MYSDQQYILRRLSEAAIDTYAMAVTLSRYCIFTFPDLNNKYCYRASRAINEKFTTSEHERVITSIFCKEAYKRVIGNLASLTHSAQLSQDEQMSSIARQLFEEKKVVATPALKF